MAALTFFTKDGMEVQKIFVSNPVGLNYKKKAPITVASVTPGSPGQQAGVQLGWEIVACNNEQISTMPYARRATRANAQNAQNATRRDDARARAFARSARASGCARVARETVDRARGASRRARARRKARRTHRDATSGDGLQRVLRRRARGRGRDHAGHTGVEDLDAIKAERHPIRARRYEIAHVCASESQST